MDKSKLKRAIGGPADLAKYGRVVPHVVDGKRRGLEFVDVAPAGVLGQLGITNGDVLMSVDGRAINSPQQAFSLWKHIHTHKTFDVVVERGRTTRHHRYVVHP